MPEPVPEPEPGKRQSKEHFDHERLDVFKVSIEFVVLAHETVLELPQGRLFSAINYCGLRFQFR